MKKAIAGAAAGRSSPGGCLLIISQQN